jgi:hypothetical protein
MFDSDASQWSMQMNWFSTKIRVALLIEDAGLVSYMDSVHVFQAKDFDEAKQRALELGRGHEEEYLNSDQQRVRWRFKEIVSLDLLGSELSNGCEVYSEPVKLGSDEHLPFDVNFDPQFSRPTQTI